MLDRFKSFWQGVVLAPFVNLFIRLGVSPDAVTLVGTAGVCAGALIFFPRGHLFGGVLFITIFIFSDLIDGAMARKIGRTSKFGAFFDSTLDRVGDAAIFGGLVLYFAGPGDSYLYLCLTLYCLVMGAVTSYARARAESLGLKAEGGIAERADRTVAILVTAGVSDWWNLPIILEVTTWLLAVAITTTVLQRIWMVRRQTLAEATGESPDPSV
jgi:CDP-diacylglycerol--glycerol-3-phosphate 3-phosphatidyltransferase/CDP-diacylglycerol--inositol 3-phosphatidyltransferase